MTFICYCWLIIVYYKLRVQAYVIDKSVLGLLVAGIPYMFDRAGLDIAQGNKNK